VWCLEMNKKPFLISAVGTPLKDGGALHREALSAHLSDQWKHGIDGVLIAGSMGTAQLLADDAYRDLIQHGTECARGCGEVFVGVGDTSYDRTRCRIEYVNSIKVDAVVILTPYLIRYQNTELIDYYSTLADISDAPIYLYDLPALVGWSVPIEVILDLASHPNIHGIKCSCPLGHARMIEDQVGQSFRIIHAQPLLLDRLLRSESLDHLDGIFSLAPAWTKSIGDAAQVGDWKKASDYQNKIIQLIQLLARFGVYPSYSALLNARDIPGNYAPRPIHALAEVQLYELLNDPIARELIHCSG